MCYTLHVLVCVTCVSVTHVSMCYIIMLDVLHMLHVLVCVTHFSIHDTLTEMLWNKISPQNCNIWYV